MLRLGFRGMCIIHVSITFLWFGPEQVMGNECGYERDDDSNNVNVPLSSSNNIWMKIVSRQFDHNTDDLPVFCHTLTIVTWCKSPSVSLYDARL